MRDDLTTIGDMAKRFGVTHRTLRFYEDKGLITPTRDGTRRLYSEADVARFARIHGWASAGLSLSEIKSMLETFERNPGSPLLAAQLQERFDEIEARLRSQLSAIAMVRPDVARDPQRPSS